MHSHRTIRTIVVGGWLIVALAGVAVQAGPIAWFDETGGTGGYASFEKLSTSYQAFMGSAVGRVDFNGLSSGSLLGDQYADSLGVRFLNTGAGRYASSSGIHPEGDACAEDVTGYDGSYMPNGDALYLKFDNHLSDSPFTILFDQAVQSVGAFVGMGVQGSVHAWTVSIYGEADELLDRKTVQAWLWEKDSDRQNYESFFAARADGTLIRRVEILNDSNKDFANGLIIDNVAFDGGGRVVPEPAVIMLLALVVVAQLTRWTALPLTCRATARRPLRSNGRGG